MPRSLALETSGRTGSVALARDGVVLAEEQFPHGLKHAVGIVPIIDGLCRALGWSPRDVDQVYVSVGPGSFTGLRVGVMVAKSLAFATGAKVVAVPTADVLARNAPPGWRHVAIVLDAKRDQVYAATFGNKGEVPVVHEHAHVDDLASVLSRAPRPVHLIGEGIPYHRKFIPADNPGVIVTEPELWQARAAAVVDVGSALSRRGQFTDPDLLAPLYIRRAEAEEKFEAKR